jgi:hypothetical protein
MENLKNAVRERSPVFENFDLTYEIGAFSYGLERTQEYVHIVPRSGFVPRGYIRVDKLLEEDEDD